MREGLVICPKFDNNGNPLETLKDAAVRDMIAAFGGCTIREAQGAWVNPDGKLFVEPVWELVSAYDPDSLAGDAALTDIAKRIGTEGRQEAVYLRYASGDVEIVSMAEFTAEAA